MPKVLKAKKEKEKEMKKDVAAHNKALGRKSSSEEGDSFGRVFKVKGGVKISLIARVILRLFLFFFLFVSIVTHFFIPFRLEKKHR